MGNTIENIQEVMGKDFDPFGGELDKLSATNPGKVFSRTKQQQHSRSSSPQVQMTDYPDDSPDPTTIIKWLVALAVVILLIVLAIKLL